MNRKRSYHRFLLLWAGELVSSIGSGLTSFGLGVYVFRQTGSAADMALIALLAFLPTLLLSVPAGVQTDRIGKRLEKMGYQIRDTKTEDHVMQEADRCQGHKKIKKQKETNL